MIKGKIVITTADNGYIVHAEGLDTTEFNAVPSKQHLVFRSFDSLNGFMQAFFCVEVKSDRIKVALEAMEK